MRNIGALAIAAAGENSLPLERSDSANFMAGLFRPLPFLLVGGGDARLSIDPASKSNVYGCSAAPRPQALVFSSSTATSISERAYRRAEHAREELIEEIVSKGIVEAFDSRIERMRDALRSHLQLDSCEIMFSPSGTDSQLHALFFARQLLGGSIACIVAGADQTGSGTAHTSRGRHFSHCTAQGKNVVKATPIAGHDSTSIGIALFAQDGAIRSESENDSAVIDAVARQIEMGRKVVLQIMDSSKLGWRAPTDACLREIGARWPHAVQIVVDACQMRIGRPRIAEYLSRGYIVLLTGSKFFGGPAFSGASLWPQALASRIAAMDEPPEGLAEYATRFDLPLKWHCVRESLPGVPNFGQWLRWEAALEEMRAYFALPDSWRSATLARLTGAVAAAIKSSPDLELLNPRDTAPDSLDDGMQATILPFFVKQAGRALDLEEITLIYRALNCDLSSALPDTASDGERALASQRCHIGQPVELPAGTVLRIAIGARNVTDAYSHDNEESIDKIIREIGTVVRKIELILAIGAHLEMQT